MNHSDLRPHIALIIGVIGIGLGLMETISGDAMEGYGRGSSRSEEPERFWKAVAVHYLCGVAGVGYFLYERFLTK
jgi:uncharacterized membrane protein